MTRKAEQALELKLLQEAAELLTDFVEGQIDESDPSSEMMRFATVLEALDKVSDVITLKVGV